ncbi:MAG: discoidin domain-containing protein [Myxococcota bacterium]
MHKSIFASMVASAMAVACGDLPEPVVNGTATPSDQQQTKSLKPEPPELSTRTTISGFSSLPIRGSAEKEATIIVEGGAAPTAADVQGTGNFCVDVALKEGRNDLKIFVQRLDDSRSDTVSYRVTYDPTIAEDEVAPEEPAPAPTGQVRDVAVRKAVGASVAGNGISNITDADDGTYANFSSYPALYIDLGTTYNIQEIEIVWAANATTDGTYADEYDVMTSLQTSPTRPMDASTTGWSVVSSVVNGDGGEDAFQVGTPISARWVGITVNSNATSWYSWDWSVNIASIRVFAPEIITGGGGTGNIGPPTCENGD